jgi:hypothetical protein
MSRKTRIVILGDGFGGATTARHLERLCRRRRDVEIVNAVAPERRHSKKSSQILYLIRWVGHVSGDGSAQPARSHARGCPEELIRVPRSGSCHGCREVCDPPANCPSWICNHLL